MWTAVTKQVLGAAKVTKTLFANVTDEEDVCVGLYIVVLQGTKYTQYDNQAARIVADARCIICVALDSNGHVGFDRKHRIEMRNIGDNLATRPPWPPTDNITDFINSYVRQAGFPQHFGKPESSLLFSKRWSGDLG